MNATHIAAIASGGVHFLAYLAYAIALLRGRIEGNPLSWLMFAYGTSLMAFLELSAAAPWTELVLPVTCAVSSVLIAVMTFKPGAWRGLEPIDFVAFTADVVLTIAYGAAWLATHSGHLPADAMTTSLGVFLIAANASTAVQFIPILRSTWAAPENEQAAPWLLWTSAYAILLGVTLIETPDNFALIVYPLTGVTLHSLMALCIFVGRWRLSMMRARA